jgi:hypothetical protein
MHDPAIALGISFDDRAGAIGARVIADKDFDVRIEILREDALDAVRDIALLVEADDAHRNDRPL